MINGLIGKKVGMTQVFAASGEIVPVSVVQAGPCTVTQVKTSEIDGYEAVQLGYGLAKKLNSPEKGHLKRLPALRYLREFKVDKASDYQLGQTIDASLFKAGDRVDVVGVSKGKGFAGVVKRYHFAGGPKTHGQSDRHRAPGAISSGTTPGRILKGKRMAGRMGGERVTVADLVVVQADAERNLLLIKGAVPGGVNGLLLVKRNVPVK
jgi:large subunit ribosomal protein L3